ncbi:hypothetical protein [Neolewinella sp.]|uniref:hypothetical protein n=1 Tax=Neolewinella sp. TaxID=2993543 RepID=UPI003B515623
MAPLTKIRLCLVIVMAGLFVAGVTAFPLLAEVNWLSQLLVGTGGSLDPALYDGVTQWILTVRQGLEVTYRDYLWLAYGTDWLAFGHLMIMLFFILPYRDPVRYEGVLWVGIWASLLVFPLAFICGPLRGIPWYWQLVDCGFGVGSVVPLGVAVWEVRGMGEGGVYRS